MRHHLARQLDHQGRQLDQLTAERPALRDATHRFRGAIAALDDAIDQLLLRRWWQGVRPPCECSASR